MSWHNAPPIKKLTSTQLGGKRGAQLWGVDSKGALYSTYQLSFAGGWSDWRGPGWNTKKKPDEIYDLAAAILSDGRAQLWALDMKRQLWTITQQTAGGLWNDWEGPNWNKPPGTQNLTKIAAVHSKGKTRLFGILDKGGLISCEIVLPSGVGAWGDFPKTKEGLPWITVVGCTQGTNQKGALWGIDSNFQLWGIGQNDNGVWPEGGWTGPNWLKAPKVRDIAAVDMGGTKGASIWAITEENKVIYNWQQIGGMDSWLGWQPGDSTDKLRAYALTAAMQTGSLPRVWAITTGDVLTSQEMERSSHNWPRRWDPPAP